MPSLYETLTESYRRLVSKLLPGVLRNPDRVMPTVETSGRSDACRNLPKSQPRPRSQPTRDTRRYDTSTAINGGNMKRKFIYVQDGLYRVRITVGMRKVSCGMYSSMDAAVKARNAECRRLGIEVQRGQ